MADAPLNPSLVVVGTTDERARVDRWSLALVALGIPHQVAPLADRPGSAILVLGHDVERAQRTLHDVDTEHVQRLHEAATAPPLLKLPPWAMPFTQLMVAGLLVMAMVAGMRVQGSPWVAAGHMDAATVFTGEWYRLFTAVTLHADGAHLASNMLFLAVVAPTVVHRLGPGAATAILVLAGVGGNVLSAWHHGAPFSNVGASGGVFGLTGALAVVGARTRRSRLGGNRWLLGLGAGLALLMMLGFGDHSDITAHVGGFVVGTLMGLGFPVAYPAPPSRAWWTGQAGLVAASVGALGFAWALALHAV